MAEPYGDDEVYFSTKRVHLVQVPGKAVPYCHATTTLDHSDEGVRSTRRRVKRCGHIAPELADVVIPAIPATDVVMGLPEKPADAVAAWPDLLRRPLMKVKEAVAGEPKAVASGVRSCCVKLEDRWFRLKGCGNDDEGFIIREHPKTKEEEAWRELRGAAFTHTAARELYMTSALDAPLRGLGVSGANSALGYYEYCEPNAPLGPLVPPVCIVEETFGDRRFGSHVCSGLQVLLSSIVDEAAVDLSGLLGCFPQARPGRTDAAELVTTAQLMTDQVIAFEMGLPGNGITWPDVARDETSLANIADFALPLRAPAEVPRQWTNDGVREMDPRWREAWDAAAKRVEAGAKSGRALAYLYSRCGYECGAVLRGMHKERVSWGTYQDGLTRSDIGQWHCNAHANNMVLIREGTHPSNFLSYLDLDMAFDERTFLSLVDDAAGVGVPPAEHDHLLKREEVNFLETLVGADSSTGVPQVAMKEIDSRGPVLKTVQTALFDTLALGFLRGYSGDERFPVAAYDAELHGTAHAFVKLAVMIMSDFVA